MKMPFPPIIPQSADRKRCHLLVLLLLCIPAISFAQVKPGQDFINGTFPESWDTKQSLRHKCEQVLLWKQASRGHKTAYRKCILVLATKDSAGGDMYFISEMYSTAAPFTKWSYGFINYANGLKDTVSGLTFGFHDLHLEVYHHTPTEAELMALLRKWEFFLYDKQETTRVAGIDNKLWLKTFGFVPNLDSLQ